jgi:SAM-dependent methyltransferase
VEEFSHARVAGWVAVYPDADPVRVSLYLNSLEVAATWLTDPVAAESPDGARQSWGEIRPFQFRIRDVWDYAKTDGRLSVRIGPRPLPITGHGTYLSPPGNGKHRMGDLRERFDEGYLFSHDGRLQLSRKKDSAWLDGVIGLYREVRSVVRERFGHDCFLIYGTLLGAVREGGVIGHDDDFDAAYLSRHSDPAQAAAELHQIALALIDAGFEVETRRTALHIHRPGDDATRVDLFHLYFDAAGALRFPFGIAGTTSFTRSDWTGVTEIDFLGARVTVPTAAEQLVEHIYGSGWRRPKPGFFWNRDRTGWAKDGWLCADLRESAYWSNFYAHHQTLDGSPFFEHVHGRADIPPVVVDIGCGDGRDSRAFASSGHQVIGIDRADTALRTASVIAAQQGLEQRVRFVNCDLSDVSALTDVLTAARCDTANAGSMLFYLRFLLHSVTGPVQEGLMAVIAELARPGDMFAAEFRTDQDEGTRKVHGNHFRRFQNGPAFGARLCERYGFTVLEEAEGTGLSPYRDEDPVLYRVVARRAQLSPRR